MGRATYGFPGPPGPGAFRLGSLFGLLGLAGSPGLGAGAGKGSGSGSGSGRGTGSTMKGSPASGTARVTEASAEKSRALERCMPEMSMLWEILRNHTLCRNARN